MENLHKLAASTPLGPAGARSMAVVALKAGEYRLALRLLDDCERGRPSNRDLADLRARALLGLGAFEQARATATELLRTQASDKYARQILSTAEARQKNAAVSLLAASPADAPEVAKLARQVALTGAANDANALSWCPEPTAGQASSLNGPWYFRRSSQKTPNVWTMGTATVLTLGDRVYVEMKDKDRRFLLEAQRTENRLAGRMLNLANAADSTPWVGLIVDPERIDGQFGGGRWDLRRRLPEPLTVPPRLEERN